MIDLVHFLMDIGACVEGYLSREGKSFMAEYSIIPDRVEADTFILAAAVTRSCILMSPIVTSHLSCLPNKVVTAGCKVLQFTPNILGVSFSIFMFLFLFVSSVVIESYTSFLRYMQKLEMFCLCLMLEQDRFWVSNKSPTLDYGTTYNMRWFKCHGGNCIRSRTV